MKKKLNIRQRKFVEEYIKSGNATQAVKKAGYKKKNAAAGQGSRLLTNANIQSSLLQAQKAAGIDDAFLTQTLKEGLKAEVTKFFAEKGVVQDEKNCIDFPTRQKYLDTAHKLRGDYAPEKLDVTNEREIKEIQADIRKLFDKPHQK